MFVQVIKGKVKDAAALRARSEQWESELKPGAKGYLGATEGVADDGTFIAVVRFESEEAARTNSDRPEQSAWWEETSKLFDGDVSFRNSSDIDTMLGGGSDDAGFVQIMEGRTTNQARLREMMPQFEAEMPKTRPDLIGGMTVWHDGGQYTDVIYFRSEEEARAGEKQDMTSEMTPELEEMMTLVEVTEYIDLREPWLYSA
jgi:hypothetical protein